MSSRHRSSLVRAVPSVPPTPIARRTCWTALRNIPRAAIGGVQGTLRQLIYAARQGHTALVLFDHHLAVVEAEPDLPAPIEPHPVAPLVHGIEFRDVWFRYGDDHPWVLRGCR
ncbi:hypothetical protein AB0G04_40975 [Actinoplanes sp. NPDC023801]|uniref:hypothetical protein n=1 Tax=Actinoplanes sp. NPDC023801 TaxID=3154595 RepID=UPI0033DAC72A